MRRLTQQQLADRAGVERDLVRMAEQAAVSVDLTRLRRLAWAAGVPLSELLEEDREVDRLRREGPELRR